MPFPFLWGGALFAAVFLGVTIAAFALAMHVVDRAWAEVRDSVIPGMVSGVREWAVENHVATRPTDASGSAGQGPLEEMTDVADFALERIRPAIHQGR